MLLADALADAEEVPLAVEIPAAELPMLVAEALPVALEDGADAEAEADAVDWTLASAEKLGAVTVMPAEPHMLVHSTI